MNWKFWSPMHTKEHRDIIDNMTEEEKKEFLELSRETGKKIGRSYFPIGIVFVIIIFISDGFPPKLIYNVIIIVTCFLNIIITRNTVVIPQNEKTLNFI